MAINLSPIIEGITTYDVLTYKADARSQLSKETSANTKKQGMSFGAIAGGLDKKEQEQVSQLFEKYLKATPNNNRDLLSLLSRIDSGELLKSFSADSKRKIKEGLIIADYLSFKAYSRKKLSLPTQELTKQKGFSISAIPGLEGKNLEIVKVLGEKYLKAGSGDPRSDEDLEALKKQEALIRQAVCQVIPTECPAPAGEPPVSESKIEDNSADLKQKGWDLLVSGKKEEAKKALVFFNDALKLAPNDPEILTGKGWALYTLNKYQEAIIVLTQALTLAKDDQELSTKILRARGASYLETRQFLKALDDCNTILGARDQENDIEPLYLRSKAKDQLGDFSAIADFNQVLELDKTAGNTEPREKPVLWAANDLKSRKDLGSALPRLKRVAQSPEVQAIYLAWSRELNGQPTEALASLRLYAMIPSNRTDYLKTELARYNRLLLDKVKALAAAGRTAEADNLLAEHLYNLYLEGITGFSTDEEYRQFVFGDFYVEATMLAKFFTVLMTAQDSAKEDKERLDSYLALEQQYPWFPANNYANEKGQLERKIKAQPVLDQAEVLAKRELAQDDQKKLQAGIKLVKAAIQSGTIKHGESLDESLAGLKALCSELSVKLGAAERAARSEAIKAALTTSTGQRQSIKIPRPEKRAPEQKMMTPLSRRKEELTRVFTALSSFDPSERSYDQYRDQISQADSVAISLLEIKAQEILLGIEKKYISKKKDGTFDSYMIPVNDVHYEQNKDCNRACVDEKYQELAETRSANIKYLRDDGLGFSFLTKETMVDLLAKGKGVDEEDKKIDLESPAGQNLLRLRLTARSIVWEYALKMMKHKYSQLVQHSQQPKGEIIFDVLYDNLLGTVLLTPKTNGDQFHDQIISAIGPIKIFYFPGVFPLKGQKQSFELKYPLEVKAD